MPLFDLGFLIKHVLPNGRIVLSGLHLLRVETLVLGCRVVVSGSGTGYEFYFFAHELFLRPGSRHLANAPFRQPEIDAACA